MRLDPNQYPEIAEEVNTELIRLENLCNELHEVIIEGHKRMNAANITKGKFVDRISEAIGPITDVSILRAEIAQLIDRLGQIQYIAEGGYYE